MFAPAQSSAPLDDRSVRHGLASSQRNVRSSRLRLYNISQRMHGISCCTIRQIYRPFADSTPAETYGGDLPQPFFDYQLDENRG